MQTESFFGRGWVKGLLQHTVVIHDFTGHMCVLRICCPFVAWQGRLRELAGTPIFHSTVLGCQQLVPTLWRHCLPKSNPESGYCFGRRPCSDAGEIRSRSQFVENFNSIGPRSAPLILAWDATVRHKQKPLNQKWPLSQKWLIWLMMMAVILAMAIPTFSHGSCFASAFLVCVLCSFRVCTADRLCFSILSPHTRKKKLPKYRGRAGIFGLCSVCVRCDPSVLRLCPTWSPPSANRAVPS